MRDQGEMRGSKKCLESPGDHSILDLRSECRERESRQGMQDRENVQSLSCLCMLTEAAKSGVLQNQKVHPVPKSQLPGHKATKLPAYPAHKIAAKNVKHMHNGTMGIQSVRCVCVSQNVTFLLSPLSTACYNVAMF